MFVFRPKTFDTSTIEKRGSEKTPKIKNSQLPLETKI
jgi:hypothetical protein